MEPALRAWTRSRQGELSYDDLLRITGGGCYSTYHHDFLFGSLAAFLAARFGTQGSPVPVSTACVAGATAIQLGVEAIRRGEADAVLCWGPIASVDSEAVVRFSLLSALSTNNDLLAAASKPFSKEQDGFVMAEGAGHCSLRVMRPQWARSPRACRCRGLRRGERYTAPTLALTVRRSFAVCVRRSPTLTWLPSKSITSMRRTPRAGKRQDGGSWRPQLTFGKSTRFLEQIHDRPHPLRRRRRLSRC